MNNELTELFPTNHACDFSQIPFILCTFNPLFHLAVSAGRKQENKTKEKAAPCPRFAL